ncbi:hypothetical protein TRAPUB_9494 [Trametes pubescens]|uniref:Uncharacterized protein n=1 Tax=Trametes pubescens TaxID=154538 RepID=A0A1M2W252_TRAPU|nr:hypothetical protein TRAPUB_9494 [Trametes pubescens]
MYGIKYIQYIDLPALPSDVTEVFPPKSLDVGRVYLGVSLTILILFMTYYVVTLSFELYRTIVSLSLPLLHSAKQGLRASAPTVDSCSEVTPLQREPEIIISSASVPSVDLDICEDGASTSDGGSQADSHDGPPSVTSEGEGQCAFTDNTVEVPAENASSEASVDSTPTLADLNCHYSAEQVRTPGAEHEALESHVNEAGSSEHVLESPPIPDIAAVAGNSGAADNLGSKQAGADDMPTPSADEDQAADAPVDASPSFLLLPALPAIAGLEAGDNSLQPSAASVALLSAVTPYAARRPDDIIDRVHEESPEPALSDDLSADTITVDTNRPDTPSSDPVSSEGTPKEITAEDDVPGPSKDATTAPPQVLEQSSEESTPGAADAVEAIEAVEVMSASDPKYVDDRIMESALLVGEDEPHGEEVLPALDVDHDADWTTVEREDGEVEQEHIPQPDAAREGSLDTPEVTQQDPEPSSITDVSVDVLTHSECAELETSEVVPPPVSESCDVPAPVSIKVPSRSSCDASLPVLCEVSAVVVEAAPTQKEDLDAPATPSVTDCPEIERTLCLTLLDVAPSCAASLLDAASVQAPVPMRVPVAPTPAYVSMASTPTPASTPVPDFDNPVDVYVGPLPGKLSRVRVHTEEKPDWAVAPEQPKPKPSISGGGGRNTSGNVKCGPARKVSMQKQGVKPSGKDKQKRGVPARAPAAQRQRVSSAPSKTSAALLWAAADPANVPAAPAKGSGGTGSVRESMGRRSARLA